MADAGTVKRLAATQVEVEFAIPPEELERARERAFRELSKRTRIPGFRPGKAPRKIFEANYGTAAIEERAMDEVLNDAWTRAVRENHIEPVDRPTVERLPEESDGAVRLRATVSVRPEITLGTYKGIVVSAEPAVVSDDDVDRSLEALRRDQASLIPVERAVEPGDIATLDYEGTIDGEAFEGGSAQNQPTEIREDRFIPGFAAGIVGMSAGETKQIEARFPDDFAKPELAGKTAHFTVTVHDVKIPEFPNLDDEFAARFLREGSLDQLRSDLRGRLERTSEARVRRAMTGELLEKLRTSHDVALPEVLVERETESLVDEERQFAKRRDVDWNEYLRRSGKTEDQLRSEARAEAERRVKTALLLEEIARTEKIEATQADVNAELANLSAQYRQPIDVIRALVARNMGALIDGIVRSKTVDFLLDHATRVEAKKAPAP
jgi:trigger factor